MLTDLLYGLTMDGLSSSYQFNFVDRILALLKMLSQDKQVALTHKISMTPEFKEFIELVASDTELNKANHKELYDRFQEYLAIPLSSDIESAVLQQATRKPPIVQSLNVVNHVVTEQGQEFHTKPTEIAVEASSTREYGLMKKAAGLFDQQQMRDPAWKKARRKSRVYGRF